MVTQQNLDLLFQVRVLAGQFEPYGWLDQTREGFRAMKELRTIILAAGKGTRMKSVIPKVLHPGCDKPIIQYVLDVSKALGSLKTYVVLGHKSEVVKNALEGQIVPVNQPKMLGTADAVKCVSRYFKSYRGDILILCGDTPLLDKATVKRVGQKHKKSKAACTFLTPIVHNPKGYGRIIRGEDDSAVGIREGKATDGCERDFAGMKVGG